MPVHTEFIRQFLTRWETRRLVAYIPCKRRNFTGRENPAACGEPIGASGVTVGTGLDLGQQGEADLRRMGLDGAIISRFRPYLGKKRQDAVAALAAAPLTLSEAECDAVDDAVQHLGELLAQIDRKNGRGRFIGSQAVVVARAHGAQAQGRAVFVHGAQHGGQKDQELRVVLRRGAGVEQILAV